MTPTHDFGEMEKEAESAVSSLLAEGDIEANCPGDERARFSRFFRKQADLSLVAADLLYAISTDRRAKEFHKLPDQYECFLWVINPAYYAMFYAAQALLAARGVRIRSRQGVHKKTAHALVHFCVRSGFIAKELYAKFAQGQDEAAQLLSIEDCQEKARQLATSYSHEASKRSTFTYETTEEVRMRHALTSLRRAKEFLAETEIILGS